MMCNWCNAIPKQRSCCSLKNSAHGICRGIRPPQLPNLSVCARLCCCQRRAPELLHAGSSVGPISLMPHAVVQDMPLIPEPRGKLVRRQLVRVMCDCVGATAVSAAATSAFRAAAAAPAAACCTATVTDPGPNLRLRLLGVVIHMRIGSGSNIRWLASTVASVACSCNS